MAGEDFQAVAESVYALYGQGRMAEALEAALDARDRFPDRPAVTTYWIACLRSVLGQTEEALRVLEAGIDRGLWWADPVLRTDPDLAPLRGDAPSEAVVEESARRRRAAAAGTSPERVVSGLGHAFPEDFADRTPEALAFVLGPSR